MRITNSLKRSQHSLELFVAAGVITCLLAFARERVISAYGDEIAPGANLELVGVPRIPKSLAHQVKRYTVAYGLPLAGWDVVKRKVWLKGLSTVTWLTRIENPGSELRMWIYIYEHPMYWAGFVMVGNND